MVQMADEPDAEVERRLNKALADIDVVNNERASIFIPAKQLLYQMPSVITRHEMFEHWKMLGHIPDDISCEAFAKQKIRCPIYWANEKQKIVFNNYLCSCGRLFVFKSKFQKDANGRDIVAPDFNYGVCPCDVCRHWIEGIGCHYADDEA